MTVEHWAALKVECLAASMVASTAVSTVTSPVASKVARRVSRKAVSKEHPMESKTVVQLAAQKAGQLDEY